MNFIKLIAFCFILLTSVSYGAVNSLYLTLEGSSSTKRTTVNRLLTSGTSLVGDGSNIPQVVDIATQAELNALSSVYQPLNANTSILGSTISLAEMANLASGTFIGRYSSGSGVPEAITFGPKFITSGGVLDFANDYQIGDDRLDQLIDGSLTFRLQFAQGYSVNGPAVAALPAMVGTDMDLEKYGETYSATADTTLAFLGTPVEGQIYQLNIEADSTARITTIPSAFSVNANQVITNVTTPSNGNTFLTFRYQGASWLVFGDPPTTVGTGSYLLETSPVIITPSITGAIGFQDGVLQTFNPNGTNAGLNVGSVAGDPSTPTNGSLWYDSTANELTARINGVNVALGAGGGGGGGDVSTTDIDTSAELKAILTDETGTGAAVFAGSPTFTGTVVMDTLTVTSLFADSLEFNDTDDSHQLSIVAGSNLTADRIFTLSTGDAARTLTLSGNPTLGDWFDQAVKTTSSPTFNNLVRTGTNVYTPSAMGALAVNIEKQFNTKTVSADSTLTWSATPTVAGQEWGVEITNSGGAQITITFPSCKDGGTGSAVSTGTISAGGLRNFFFRYNGTDTIAFLGGSGGGSGIASTDIDTSAELRGILTDETGTGAAVFVDGAIGAATATTASAGDSDTSVATTAFVNTEVDGTRTGTHASPYTTASSVSPTWSGQFHAVYMGIAQTVNLPAASSYDGRGILIYNTGAFVITVDSNASEVIVRDGTAQTGGVSFTLSTGAGNYVTLISDGTRWITLGYKGTLAEGS